MRSQFVQAGGAPPPPSIGERRLRAFQQRIDRDEKIEAGDWMPDEYRKSLARPISQHAKYSSLFNCPALMMPGPRDSDSTHGEQSMKRKSKRHGNDEIRRKFLDQTVPQLEALGLTAPDPELRYDAKAECCRCGAMGRDEFQRVISGYGQRNKHRLKASRQARESQARVREAAAADEGKRRRSQAQ